MESQNISSQRGEVEFRKKLAVQHVTGETLIPEYYGKTEHDQILLERMETTARDMKALGPEIVRSPFVELGAERCQRSLVLANDFGATGFAADISFHQLRTASHFAERFGRSKLPFRVCCDINRLPFRSGAIPFVFCYEFLHHFPTPMPIVKEAHRVLSQGTFFFNEEPFKRPRLVLFHQSHKQYSEQALRKGRVRKFLESFFSEECCDEREHGIIENDEIPLREWDRSLSVFESRQVVAYSLGNRIRSSLRGPASLRNLPNLLLGGGIRGLCKKETGSAAPQVSNLSDLLVCPDCMASSGNEVGLRLSSNGQSSYQCSACKVQFPVIDDVTILLPTSLRHELYPEFG